MALWSAQQDSKCINTDGPYTLVWSALECQGLAITAGQPFFWMEERHSVACNSYYPTCWDHPLL